MMIYVIKDPTGEYAYEFEVSLDTDYDGNPVINICNTSMEFEWGDPAEVIDLPLTAAEELIQILKDLLKEAKKLNEEALND